MPTLEKAVLEEIVSGSGQTARARTPDPARRLPVQFNPTSLRMQISNRTEGGEQPGRQSRQYVGTGSTTLSLELVYDTADEGSTELPLSTMDYTKQLEYFITPRAQGNQRQAPPRVRFRWARIEVEGVVDFLSVDYDHFAQDGTPLRAKASLTIKGQNADYEFGVIGAGANQGGGEPPPGEQPSAGLPGASNNNLSRALNGLTNNPVTNALNSAQGAVNRFGQELNSEIARALDGESLAQLAQRAGLDPNAWRALSSGLANPLTLTAGMEIPIGGAIGLSAGIGVQAGVQLGSRGEPANSLGLGPSNIRAATEPALGRTGALAQGYALSSAGGVGAALETVRSGTVQAGRRDAKLAFAGAAGAAEPPSPEPPGGRMAVFAQRADPRVISFGKGVPLRDLIQTATDERANALNGQARVKAGPPLEPGFPPSTLDPSRPAWAALPLRALQRARGPAASRCACGCGCGSGCRRGGRNAPHRNGG